MDPTSKHRWTFDVAISSKKFHTRSKQFASLVEHSFEELVERADSTTLEAEKGVSHEEFVSQLPTEVRLNYFSEMDFLSRWRGLSNANLVFLSPDVQFVFNPRGVKPVVEEEAVETITQVASFFSDISDISNLSDEFIFSTDIDPYRLELGDSMPYEDLLPYLWKSTPKIVGPDLRGIQNLVSNHSLEERTQIEQDAINEARSSVIYVPDVALSGKGLRHRAWSKYYPLLPLSSRPPVEVDANAESQARVEIEEIKAKLKERYLDENGLVRLVILHGRNEDLCLKVLALKLNSRIIDESLVEIAESAIANITDVRKLREYERVFTKGALNERDMAGIRQEYLKIHPQVEPSKEGTIQMISGLIHILPREIISIEVLSDLVGAPRTFVEQLLLEMSFSNRNDHDC